ncbi:glycoside hydrolase family protein [Nitrospirillum iridis]|uniref:Lysozyme n=1 Tax=Nitrospirillum iridis TaxID=765888 RepID=A0A7X0EDR4_9PROT|nr:lysozyme [Nitrospirillum iridis]MBB6253048.1 lysozyme [Nitrospirillum iridis]
MTAPTLDLAKLGRDLDRDEGRRFTVYYDTARVPTIGVGHNLLTGPLDTALRDHLGIPEDTPLHALVLTDEQIDELRDYDIHRTLDAMDRGLGLWWRQLSEGRQRALANMAFNLGVAKLKTFKGTLAALQSNDFNTAAVHAMDSLWARQVGQRANRIAALFRFG